MSVILNQDVLFHDRHLINKLTESSLFRSSFSDFASKYGKDERFKAIEKMREREALFSDFVSDVRRKEKEEKSQQKEKVCITQRARFVCLFHDGLHYKDRNYNMEKWTAKIYLILGKIGFI